MTINTSNLIKQGIKNRESGNYQVGLKLLKQAFQQALGNKEKQNILESANQLSIQYRLLAGRNNRQNKPSLVKKYCHKSREIYQILKELGYLNLNDPNMARNWAHSLLYANKIPEAIIALKKSIKVQISPSAKGDEMCHLASAYLNQNKILKALPLLKKGINLIKTNNGSDIWLTYGYMTLATLGSQTNDIKAVRKNLQTAMKIALDKNLFVRKEEIEHLLTLPSSEINVLKAVGSIS